MSEEKPKSRKLLWIMLGSLLLLLTLGLGVGVGLYLLPGRAADAAAQAERIPDPIFHSLERPFIANPFGSGGRRLMQVEIQIMTRDSAVVTAIGRVDPIIRNDLLALFSSRSIEEIDSSEGREQLRQETLLTIRQILDEHGLPSEVESLLFTSFILR